MNVDQIFYFLVLCEELHFTRAAERCRVAQPSLTNAIRALEAEIGGPLFHRRPKPRLSGLGKSVQPHLRLALTHIELAVARGKRLPFRVSSRVGKAKHRHLERVPEQ
jgi:LysR family transcriptional regulator, hydrogen peroxide-inducible genes activator